MRLILKIFGFLFLAAVLCVIGFAVYMESTDRMPPSRLSSSLEISETSREMPNGQGIADTTRKSGLTAEMMKRDSVKP